ncbi:MAG: choice-of-anchor D domain-containing protein [Acidimicrobiia bacterium]
MVAVLAVLGALGALLATRTITAEAVPAAVSASLNEYGFPNWYEDDTGIRVEPCLDPTNPQCVLNPTPGIYNPGAPTVFPTNFPDEFFYSIVDSDRLTTPGCAGAADPLAAGPGRAFVRLALEGAFATGAPIPGDQMVFGRVRVNVDGGLCPDTAYTFTHPYGTTTLTTDGSGSIPAGTGTVDVGCVPVAPTTCDYAEALGSPILDVGLLRWDPAVAPAAPAGYLGGGAGALNSIVGGVNNVFTITDGAGATVVTTNQFEVSAKLAGPLQTRFGQTDLGGAELAATATATVTVTNVDATTVNITAATTGTAEFAVTGGSCVPNPDPVALTEDASCTVQLAFTPAAVGLRTDTLTITHDGAFGAPFTHPLQGTGINVGDVPGIAVSTPTIAFGPTRLAAGAAPQQLIVSNPGSAPLLVTAADVLNDGGSFDAADRDAFVVTSNLCDGVFVPAGGSCTITASFRPVATHPYAATLQLSSNAGAPVDVALSGTGTGGIAAVSPVLNPETGFPTWYQDDAGVRLGECIDPVDPLCIVLTDPFYAGGPVIGLPSFDNFPEEYFYFVADSDVVPTPGCGAIPPGDVFVRMAHEAAFGGPDGAPVDGDQMVFGRLRIRGSGMCPNTVYTFTHPYGQTSLLTDGNGDIRPNTATVDVGCFPVAPARCDFTQSLASPVSASYLRQVTAPAGYLGDPNLFAPVTGSPFTAPGDAGPANYFRVTQGGTLIGETVNFAVMGKLVGPLMANPPTLNFGTVTLGNHDDRVVTFTNEGQGPLTVTAGAVTSVLGGPTGDYELLADACTGTTLDPVATSSDACTVTVRFHPTANGTRAAKLDVVHTALNSPLTVRITGIGGAPAGDPAISADPVAAAYPDLHTGQVSAAESIRLSNLGGQADLLISSAVLSGPGATAFTVVQDLCTGVLVAPDAECVIRVAFSPLSAGDHVASLDVASNVPSVPVLSVPLTGRGSSALPAAAAGLDGAGFPVWFQDANGVRLEPCYDPGNPQDPNCVVLADPTYNPANGLSFPGNFPSEFFYSIVESEPLEIPADDSCGGGGGAGGTAAIRMALEGAFGTGTPVAGQQLFFSRVRIQATGLCNNTTYNFEHPYGTTPVTSDGEGTVDDVTDVFNPVVDPMLTNGFLRWDPNVSPIAAPGYLGDARTFHRIVGSLYRPGGPGTEPVNSFSVSGGSLEDVSTDQFTVSGRVAGPVVGDVTSLSFAPQVEGTVSAGQSVTITNIGPVPVGSISAAVAGVDAADFVVAPAGTCTAATTLTLDQSCIVQVVFQPTSVGTKAATLVIDHSGLGTPLTVALSGTGTPAGSPEINVAPPSLSFGNQNVNIASVVRNVSVTNSGTAALTITAASTTGTGADQFLVTNNCASVDPGAPACTIGVSFRPTSSGLKSASLRIESNDPIRPVVTLALTGTGVAPVAQQNNNTLNFTARAGKTQNLTVELTNTGTAPLSLIGAPAITYSPQIEANPATDAPLKFSATHNCNNIAPGAKCKVTVTFNPGAGTVNQTFTTVMSLHSNALNTPSNVTLNGRRTN